MAPSGPAVQYTFSTSFGIVVADLDGDGKADLAASNSFSNTVGVL